jgi:hypothetical protein
VFSRKGSAGLRTLSAPDAISGLIVTGSCIGYTDDEM